MAVLHGSSSSSNNKPWPVQSRGSRSVVGWFEIFMTQHCGNPKKMSVALVFSVADCLTFTECPIYLECARLHDSIWTHMHDMDVGERIEFTYRIFLSLKQ
uniref:Uncharacterized protein n=1 Tax=Araneus ventricosus TaxID=182803 RepID=A0A4Y1ZV32_ARAVE|nr:hypothetical protein AVEN_162865-1 [Araneus ventricosus]